MCNICVFAGTTEGRELVEFLAGQPVQATVCVATEYGETLLPEAENITILAGRIPVEDIIRMLQRMRFDLVIDATHPYATSITESICTACRETETEYLRLLRQSSEQTEDVVCVENAAAAAAFLESTRGNILLTTGSKELAAYSGIPDFTQRVYARVLPMDASLEACRAAGLKAAHIIAMQGPFSRGDGSGHTAVCRRRMDGDQGRRRSRRLSARHPPPGRRAQVWWSLAARPAGGASLCGGAGCAV